MQREHGLQRIDEAARTGRAPGDDDRRPQP
jgi:hypothetical protein